MPNSIAPTLLLSLMYCKAAKICEWYPTPRALFIDICVLRQAAINCVQLIPSYPSIAEPDVGAQNSVM